MTKRNYLKYRKGELYFRNLLYKPVSLCLIALGINIKKIKFRYEYKVCSKKYLTVTGIIIQGLQSI